MAALVAPRSVDVVTWAPTTAARRRARGYDQAELLARAVARASGRPCHRLLRRAPGRAQTGHDRAERLTGPRFVARRSVTGTVLVVDDVCTTGATLAAAAAALSAAGADGVRALTAAVTPVASSRNVLKATCGTAEDGREGLVDPHDEKRIVHATD
jgi:predicted amidophosphoribosyltransferase